MDRYFEEFEDTAKEELKRAEHLVLISLKYNRTCAVMKNGLIRLIAAYETAMVEYLIFLKKTGKIEEVPASVKEKLNLVKSILGNSIGKYIRSYNKLVKVNKAQYCALNEYRKGLVMKTVGKNAIEVDIKTLEEQLSLATEFVNFIESKARE